MTSPNDQDPPDYVTGDTEENAFYEAINEKFPWLQDVDDMLRDNMCTMSTPAGEPNDTVGDMLTFVVNEAVKWGRDNAQSDMGEYVDHLESELTTAQQAKDAICKSLEEWTAQWGWSSSRERT